MLRRVKRYLYNRVTGEKYPANGCISSNEPVDAVPIQDLISENTDEIPRAVDLRPFMSPIEQQLHSNSCVANALAGAYEYLLRRDQDQTDMSRFFIYYNARKKDPGLAGEPEDNGSVIPYAIEVIKTLGACTEEKWKFVMANVNKRPTPDCYEEARNYTVQDAVEVGVNLRNMKICLARGFPFIFRLKLYQSFLKAAGNKGRVPMPKPGEPPFPLGEAHAMLAIGYNDEQQVFVVRNSWGIKWGDQGNCYIPYPYMTNFENCSQVYAIRKLNTFQLPPEHWLEDPSQMEFGTLDNLGGEENNEDNWEIIDAESESEPTAGTSEGENDDAE